MNWIAACFGALTVGIPLLLVAPVLIEPQYNILDAPLFCEIAQHVRLSDPDTYLNLERFKMRAQYGYLLYMFPCYFSVSPLWRAWFHSGILLLVPALLLYYLLHAATGRRWYALVGVPVCLCNPSFTENYYTLFKAEPWLLTGMLGTTALLYWKLVRNNRLVWWQACVYYALAVAAALLTFSLKETGGSFLAVYVCGTLLLGWAYNIDIRRSFARTWPLLLVNVAACAIEVYRLANLPIYYDASGLAGYDLTLRGIARGIACMRQYILQTAGYMVPAGVSVILLWLCYRKNERDPELRCRLGWAVFMLYFAAGALAPFIPWQGIEARQYLVAATIMPAFAVVSVAGAVDVARRAGMLDRSLALFLAILTSSLVFAHAAYSVVVGPLSEGRVRHALDRANESMFTLMAGGTSSGAVAHFMMDWAMPEPVENTRLALKVFYNRPDIDCSFPRPGIGLTSTGLIAVSDYYVLMNYNRMPLHHEAHALFYNRLSPHLSMSKITSVVYSTRIFYVTNTYHGPQYRSVWGVPAFWDLKRGVYRFGWTIYAITNVPDVPDDFHATGSANRIVNGGFARGRSGWSAWGVAGERTNQVSIVRAAPDSGSAYALRIENPGRELIGLKQHVPLVSGEVYRLSAAARSVATTDSSTIFGGRVAVFLPPQPEQQLIWMSEYNRWWPKELVFTNQVTGTAVVYVHLGYGNVATTGEFSSIRLERIERPPR